MSILVLGERVTAGSCVPVIALIAGPILRVLVSVACSTKHLLIEVAAGGTGINDKALCGIGGINLDITVIKDMSSLILILVSAGGRLPVEYVIV